MDDYKKDVIEMARDHILLWNPVHRDYKNKEQRKQVWEHIVTKIRPPTGYFSSTVRLKFHRASRFPLPTSRYTLLCSTDSHHAHNRRHLCNIFLIIIHPSQFTYRQKVNKHTFPIHAYSRMRREVVWDIFEQHTSNHFSVHVGSVKLYGTSAELVASN